MIVGDNTMQAGLSDFLKNLGKKGLNVPKKMAKNALKIRAELWIPQQTLLQQLQVEILKQLYQHYLKLLIFITQQKGFTLRNWYKLCLNGAKM